VCVCSSRCLTWRPADGGDEVIVTLPDDVDIQFRVLSSADGRYSSVAELAAAFPTCPVRVQSVRSTSRSN